MAPMNSLGARMVVILAGVTLNVLFAFLTYTGLAAKNGEQIDPVTTVGGVVVDSLPAGAEALATLQPGDRIVSINGKPAAVQGSKTGCGGTIASGATGVFVNGKPFVIAGSAADCPDK